MKHHASPCLVLLAALASFAAIPQAFAAFGAGANAFASATVVTPGETLSAATELTAYTEETGGGEVPHNPSSGVHAGKTAWWVWTAPADGFCTVDTLTTARLENSVRATLLAVYTGNTLPSLDRVIAGGSHSSSGMSPIGDLSKVSFYAIQGTQYRIVVDALSNFYVNGDAFNVRLQVRLLELKKVSRTGVFGTSFSPSGLGQVTLSTTATGGLSGKLAIGPKTYPFKGFFGLDGYFQATFAPKGIPGALPVTLQIDGTGDGFFQVTNGNTGFGVGKMPEKVVFSPLFENSTTGKFTAYLKFDGLVNPGGKGFFTLNVSKTGIVTAAGNGPDGTAITFSSSLHKHEDANTYAVPIFKSLLKGQAALVLFDQLNEMGVIDTLSGDPDGQGVYLRNPPTNTPFYPDGIACSLDLTGSTYTKPLTGFRALSFLDPTGNGTMTILNSGGELAGNVALGLNLSDKNKFTFSLLTNLPSLKLNTTTGLVTGSITIPPAKKRTIKGVLTLDAGNPVIHGYVTGITRNLAVTVE